MNRNLVRIVCDDPGRKLQVPAWAALRQLKQTPEIALTITGNGTAFEKWECRNGSF